MDVLAVSLVYDCHEQQYGLTFGCALANFRVLIRVFAISRIEAKDLAPGPVSTVSYP
jgi:hypothetical protein